MLVYEPVLTKEFRYLFGWETVLTTILLGKGVIAHPSSSFLQSIVSAFWVLDPAKEVSGPSGEDGSVSQESPTGRTVNSLFCSDRSKPWGRGGSGPH